MLRYIRQIHNVRLDSVALALNLELHPRHPVAIVWVINCRWNVQYLPIPVFYNTLIFI